MRKRRDQIMLPWKAAVEALEDAIIRGENAPMIQAYLRESSNKVHDVVILAIRLPVNHTALIHDFAAAGTELIARGFVDVEDAADPSFQEKSPN